MVKWSDACYWRYGIAGRRERKIELFRQLLDNLVIELRSIALLEHRKRRLLAADFGRKLPLGQPCLTASELYAFAELWI